MVNFICDSCKKSWKFENFFRLNIDKIFIISSWFLLFPFGYQCLCIVFCELTQILKFGVAGLLLSTFSFVICI